MRPLVLAMLCAACGTARPAVDAGVQDAGRDDAGVPDVGGEDAGPVDAGARDRAELALSTGLARGVVRGESIAFLGLPYAAPPVGARRFRPPAPVEPWRGIRDASAFGPLCPQLDVDERPVGEEDCLQLNVWIPREAPARALPVIVYVHGGSSVEGGTSTRYNGVALYDGAELAARGPAVVVTLNHRLGALGFLVHGALAEPDGATGNYGLRDQLAALRWVRAEIARFGGDPAKVLLVGQSAGGFDTCALLTAPAARGLFSRAAIHSGGCVIGDRAQDLARGEALGARLGCSGGDAAACLRAAPVGELLGAFTRRETLSGLVYHPSADGVLVPGQPLDRIRAGADHDLPVLVGTTRDELSWFLDPFLPGPVSTEAELRAAAEASFGAVVAARVLPYYPVGPDGAYAAAVRLYGDALFVCPARRAARALAAGRAPAYRFVFAHGFRGGELAALGAGHGFDLYYLFHNFGPRVPADTAEALLSEQMIARWVRFADTGEPGEGWPRYEAADDAQLTLDTPSSVERGERREACDAWDGP